MPADRLLLQGREVQHRASNGSAHVISLENLSKRVDFVGTTIIYIGYAEIGSATNLALWQIKRITFSANGSIEQLFADGDPKFNNVWDSRAGLIYL